MKATKGYSLAPELQLKIAYVSYIIEISHICLYASRLCAIAQRAVARDVAEKL